MSLSTIEYLRHILDELLFLSEQSHGLQKDEFINDAVLKRAFIRSLEIIGEATKQLPLTLRAKYSAVEWKIVASIRDKLIHHYFGIDYDIVWDVIVSDVPEMRKVIEQMMVDLDEKLSVIHFPMLQTTYQSLQQLVFSPNPLTRRLTLGLALGLGVFLIALFIGITGPIIALAAAVALIAGTMILADTHWGFVALVGVVFVIPFASLPFSVGFKPTFLDAALGALFFVWFFKLVIGQEREFIASPLGLLVGLFMLMALFSFANGLTHSSANSFLLRRFAEILLGISLFFVAVNTVRTQAELVWVTRWLLLAGWACAAIAVIFYVIPQDATVWVLDRLARFDYPGGEGALRWIEDDPTGTMRAIGTAVDPNVLGGMMILVAGLLPPQLFAQARLFPRWLTLIMLLTAVAALYLTYSRSALLGLATSVGLLAVLKYRRLIPLGIVAALLLLLLPQTQDYVARLLEGFAGEDLATQMRFGEYKDALILIGRYPIFGVGFTGVPDIDIYLGVSMLYLIIAENMGLVGLGIFVLVMIGFFVMLGRSWRRGYAPGLEAILLGLGGAVAGALVSGIFDHYWFNMTYPHMSVLFWLYVGLAVATIGMQQRKQKTAN